MTRTARRGDVEAWLAAIPSANTRDAYRRDVRAFTDWLDASGIAMMTVSTADIDEFRAHCEGSGLAPASVRRRMSAVTSMYVALVGPTGANPARGSDRPTMPATIVVAPMSASARRAVWKAALVQGPRESALMGLLLFDRFSTASAVALDAEQLRWSAGDGVVVAGRPHPLDPRTAAALRAHLGRRRRGPVFIGRRGSDDLERLTRFGADYLLKRTGKIAGLATPLTVRMLRRGDSG